MQSENKYFAEEKKPRILESIWRQVISRGMGTKFDFSHSLSQ